MRVPSEMFKKAFIILLVAFSCMFLAEFISLAIGRPISEIHIINMDLEKDTIGVWLFRALLSGSFAGGWFNFFMTAMIIKSAIGFKHWPVVVVVIMTFLFPVELLISSVFVVPNIIIYGIKSRTKNKISEVDFN